MTPAFDVAEDLVEPLRQAFKRAFASDEERIEAWLACAKTLWQARQRQRGDREFGLWLATNDLDVLGKNDRAALLHLAEHPDLFREGMMESGRSSFRLLWTEWVQPRLPNAGTPEVPPDSAPTGNRDAEETPDSPEPERDNSSRSNKSSRASASRSPLKDLPHSAIVLGHVRSGDTRSLLGRLMQKRTGRTIWDLLVESIRTGTFGPPTDTSATTANLRLIFPWAPTMYARQFDLTNREELARVRTLIVPVVLEHRDLLLRDPSQLVPVLGAATAARRQAALEARQMDPASLHQAAVTALPVTEQEVVMYGSVLWPTTPTPPWSYQVLLEACWFYRVIVPHFESVSVHRKEIHQAQATMQTINLLLKWMPTRGTPWSEAVRRVNNAYAANPEGEVRVPPSPPNFGMAS